MVSHPFPLKRQKKLANKLAESGVPPSHGLGKEFPECLRIVLAEDMGAPPALPAAPCPWIPQATQSITWPGGRRSAKYGLRFGVIYNPPKCQVGSVCWNLLDCIKACSVVMVAPCLQGGPRLVAHRLRWGPHVTGKQGQRARSPGPSARGLSEDLPGPPRPRCSRGCLVHGFLGTPPCCTASNSCDKEVDSNGADIVKIVGLEVCEMEKTNISYQEEG